MFRIAPLPALAATLSCLALAAATDAQDARNAARDAAAAKPSGQSGGNPDDPAALPANLIPVPGGRFDIGLEADDVLEIEENLFRTDGQRVRDITKHFSELGKRENVEVGPYLMARHPVTNGEYKAFVEATGHRFPFHWWKESHPESYTETLPKARETFPQSNNPAQSYWEQHYSELPWAIPKDGTQPMDDYPVVFVSWEDAVSYAAWVGMRLPTEIEWEFAARGTEDKQFVWGDDPEGHGLRRGGRFDKLYEVGHFGDKTAGVFGHEDMVLGVWEWTGELGFFPFTPMDEWNDERQRLLKNKLLRDTSDRSVQAVHDYVTKWSGDSVVCKGAMYTSDGSVLRIGTRAPIESIQTMSAIGFRLAKSQRPGFDAIDSAIKVDYDWSYFGGNIKPNLGDQVGIERYDLAGPKQERIAGYHAISFVPVTFATDDKKMRLADIADRTVEENRPLVLGTLLVTGELAEPKVPAGTYTVLYRASGAPKMLSRAIAEAKKVMKAAERSGEEPDGDFMKTLKKFNITLDDVKSGETIDFVRLNPGAFQVPAKQHSFLLRDKEGNYVAQWTAPGPLESKSRYEDGDAQIVVKAEKKGGETVSIEFGVPHYENARGKVYTQTVELKVPDGWTGGERWLLPAAKDEKGRRGRR